MSSTTSPNNEFNTYERHYQFAKSDQSINWKTYLPWDIKLNLIIENINSYHIVSFILSLLIIAFTLLNEITHSFRFIIEFMLFCYLIATLMSFFSKSSIKEAYFDTLFEYVDSHQVKIGELAKKYPKLSINSVFYLILIIWPVLFYNNVVYIENIQLIMLYIALHITIIPTINWLLKVRSILYWTNECIILIKESILESSGHNYHEFEEIIPLSDLSEIIFFYRTYSNYNNLIVYCVASGIKFLIGNFYSKIKPEENKLKTITNEIRILSKRFNVPIQIYHTLEEIPFETGRVVKN
jgi:hypothetical protein